MSHGCSSQASPLEVENKDSTNRHVIQTRNGSDCLTFCLAYEVVDRLSVKSPHVPISQKDQVVVNKYLTVKGVKG
jgi:hypothetical protein